MIPRKMGAQILTQIFRYLVPLTSFQVSKPLDCISPFVVLQPLNFKFCVSAYRLSLLIKDLKSIYDIEMHNKKYIFGLQPQSLTRTPKTLVNS